VAFISQSVVVN
jgi:cardiolipin synthase